MKAITRELIDEIILEATEKTSGDISKDYIEAVQRLVDDGIDNQMMRDCMTIGVAQRRTIEILRDILYKLFTEE